jgi:hypothetical protein
MHCIEFDDWVGQLLAGGELCHDEVLNYFRLHGSCLFLDAMKDLRAVWLKCHDSALGAVAKARYDVEVGNKRNDGTDTELERGG